MANILFDPKQFQTVDLELGHTPNGTIENISDVVAIRLSCYELGNTIDFLGRGSIFIDKVPMIFSLPISDILSTKDRTEKKGLAKNRF